MSKFLYYLVFSIVFITTNTVSAQLNTVEFNQLDSLNSIERRDVVVFVHTDWCKFCLQMKNTTFKNDSIMRLLSDNFYFVSLNAEDKKDIHYQGYTFKYRPTGRTTGVHELAEELSTINGKVNYPTISVFNNKEILFQYGGLMKSDQLFVVLKELLKQYFLVHDNIPMNQ